MASGHLAGVLHELDSVGLAAPFATVPPVYPTTYAEDARYLEAYRWHRRLKARRAARQRLGRRSRGTAPYAEWPTPMPEG